MRLVYVSVRGAVWGLVLSVAGTTVDQHPVKFVLLLLALLVVGTLTEPRVPASPA